LARAGGPVEFWIHVEVLNVSIDQRYPAPPFTFRQQCAALAAVGAVAWPHSVSAQQQPAPPRRLLRPLHNNSSSPRNGANCPLAVDVDDNLHPRQMSWQRSTVDPTLVSPGLAIRRRRTICFCGTVCLGLLDVFETQQHLSSGSVSALWPKRCRCSSLII
jgi:hypothetical protein